MSQLDRELVLAFSPDERGTFTMMVVPEPQNGSRTMPLRLDTSLIASATSATAFRSKNSRRGAASRALSIENLTFAQVLDALRAGPRRALSRRPALSISHIAWLL